jgi:hypothetical protein
LLPWSAPGFSNALVSASLVGFRNKVHPDHVVEVGNMIVQKFLSDHERPERNGAAARSHWS